MKENKWEQLKTIAEEIKKCDGYKIDNANRALEASFRVVAMNFGEMKRLLTKLPIYSHNEDEKKRILMIEILRLLANFLFSSKAFVDHMRKHCSNLYKNNGVFLEKYKNEIDINFTNNNLSQFIEGLRDYYCHVGILPIGITYKSTEKIDLKGEGVLKKETLIKNIKEFSEKGKKHIE